MGTYSKAIVAVAGAVLTAIQTQIPMSATWHGWVTVALAAVTAYSVYKVENKPAGD